MRQELNQDLVRRLLDYDPETGVLTWKPRENPQFNARYAGQAAGYENISLKYGHKCRHIGVNGGKFLEHRIIWLWVHGYLPREIDHISGDATDNRLVNLREVGQGENQKNMSLLRTNKTGCSGVRLTRSGAYAASIGKGQYLGSSRDFFEAVCIRKSAEAALQYHENHGRLRASQQEDRTAGDDGEGV